MSGRGDGQLFRKDPNPTVTVGLTLSTSSPTLAKDPSPETPFFVIVTARILKTPYPDRPITMATHLNPLDFLSNGSFSNIKRISEPSSSSDVERSEQDQKSITIWKGWPHYIFDPNDLGSAFTFVTIPAPNSTNPEFVVRHELPREAIVEAGLEVGERYRVSFAKRGLGTRWWAFGREEDFKGVRLVMWTDNMGEADQVDGDDGEVQIMEMGEKPELLEMIVESDDVDFEVVS